ncbi:sugar ABC transporter ATP-binding protein [Conexibacter woesei]|uniref:ABC transporter related protein n=1 Tax=Conexibacter woesei (strain DSM 14684 / CCUG 47730 / CIP 108061 / JCM 11494 / NBRC 100937 / ID131577) TaxID=469383 RepID=D3FEL9_CONWI|nr:sugar ABC transporter ATP-binding protein [Conexibacter woesei]ADB49693.1 ABC transporter related protein [Conexibacter woesei DSM 14684]
MTERIALRTENLTKRYGGVVALAGVDVSIRPGEVTALLGENGAGKSTFVACCSGARAPDDGAIHLDGVEQRFRSPHAAAAAGVAVVHQEPQMLEDQTVAQNVNVAMLAGGGRQVLSRTRVEALAGDQLASLGLAHALDPAQPIRRLSGAQRQLVEIARALVIEPKVLFLDEPNASLGDEETELLFGVVGRLRSRGVAVVLISHRLRDVYRIAERVVIMRDGSKVADGSVDEYPIDAAIGLMGGRPRRRDAAAVPAAACESPRRAEPVPEPVLELRGISGRGFSDVDLVIRPGEIVGMAGLVGAGRTEIAHGVIGAAPLRGGEVLVEGVPRRLRSPGDAIRHGIVYVAEDRKDAVFYDKSIAFNVRASLLGPRRVGSGRPRERAVGRLVATLAGRLSVKAPSLEADAASLSGGNQQKLLFARAVSVEPKLLILDEPTHGVDIGTRHEIHGLIRQLAADGMAVWVISSELDEILDLATRIVVVRLGRIETEVTAGHDPIPILAAAMGAATADQGTS